MTKKRLNKILEDHRLWHEDHTTGKRADLRDADLRDADLRGADLSGADLRGADLSGADLLGAALVGANLRGADLRRADLRRANLSSANLMDADLRRANFTNANLSSANLMDADLTDTSLRGALLEGVKYNGRTAFFALVCPEEGAFIGYKKCGEYIVKLRITDTAKRSSATSRKCRCSEAEVLSITHLDGTPAGTLSVPSNWDSNFTYTVGETVRVDDFCEDRWLECAPGIHFFITREEAVQY